MTRTARRGPENKKTHEASDWSSLKPTPETVPAKDSQQKDAPGPSGKAGGGWRNKGKGQFGRKGQKDKKNLHMLLSKERRREQRRQKRIDEREFKKRCFKCRLPGHKVEDCVMSDSSQGTGICYRCGSTEHMSSACKAKGAKDAMPYASCYVCGKQGHLARSCPDNPRGLYPMGGGCKTCGSVEHFQRDCSEYLSQRGIGSKIVKTMTMADSVDAVDDDDITDVKPEKTGVKKKPKVIRF